MPLAFRRMHGWDGSNWIPMAVDPVTGSIIISRYPRGRTKPYTYASGRVKYIGRNTDIDAGETDTDWDIWKYEDAGIPEIEWPRTGAVNTEAAINALSWNI